MEPVASSAARDLPAGAIRQVPLIQRKDLLKARLRAAPASPGVYLFRNALGQVIYVGKSAVLRHRLRSYFAAPAAHPMRTRRLVEMVHDFEVVATGTEQEALILENTLIKRHHPRFNVRLRDDKNYLYVRIPHPAGAPTNSAGSPPVPAEFPRPAFTRRIVVDGARYFGPYTDAKTIRGSLRELRAAAPFRACSDSVFRQGRVCLDYHLGICAGPCEGRIAAGEYSELLNDAAAFLSGHTDRVLCRLEASMHSASEAMEFELAGALRDRVKVVRRLSEEQVTAPRTGAAVDVIGLAVHGAQGVAAVLTIREGRLHGVERHLLEGVGGLATQEVLASFVGQFYGKATAVPAAVVVPSLPEEAAALARYLEGLRGGPVGFRVPRRGFFVAMLERASETAEAALAQSIISQDFDEQRGSAALADLQHQLGLAVLPQRMECYDISNTMGQQSVGSMVVFEGGIPRVSDYRIFGIRTVDGPNDFASMEEVIMRRFAHVTASAGSGEPSLGVVPDLVIVDGGAGQLASADRAMVALGMEHIPHFGLAKRFEEMHQVGGEPLHLLPGSPALFLVQRVRDEAHRFAITRHRARRRKAGLKSRLDAVTGLGPKRKRVLLLAFGSVGGIREASLEELVAVPGVTRAVAAAIKELL